MENRGAAHHAVPALTTAVEYPPSNGSIYPALQPRCQQPGKAQKRVPTPKYQEKRATSAAPCDRSGHRYTPARGLGHNLETLATNSPSALPIADRPSRGVHPGS